MSPAVVSTFMVPVTFTWDIKEHPVTIPVNKPILEAPQIPAAAYTILKSCTCAILDG